ncbi:unnamed protein product [Clavelina lepadiformis]|uniref:Large ribosomal subunit protein uL29m n=1 Tax=Clavelina lepadiformis TaxID=159417 RepID=A0ABP0GEN6_CLALP
MHPSNLLLPILARKCLRSLMNSNAIANIRPTACLLAASNCSWNGRQEQRCFHTSRRVHGLEEFFDNPENFGKLKIRSGMAWSVDLLRRKSTEDLHKLWFVLLKERNMLNTLEQYCIDEDEPMPGPDRLEKVAESMSNLRDVIEEREEAKNMLVHGTPDGIGGEWRKNPLGATYFYKYKEHLIPEHLQEIKRGDKPADLAYFSPKLEEWHLRLEEKRLKKRGGFHFLLATKYGQIRARNRHLPKKMPEWWKRKFRTKWLYGIHPQMRIFMKHHDKDYRINSRRPHKY